MTTMGAFGRGAAVLLMLGATADVGRAQTAASDEPGRFEISGGAGWWGGYDLGTTRATLPPSSGGGALFDASASIAGGGAAGARFGWRFWKAVSLEGAVTVSRASLQSTVTSDIEPALNASLETPFNQLAGEGGLSVSLPRLAWAHGRLVPFVSGGGGYLRQLYEDGVLLETGRLIYAGGGVRWGFGEPRTDRFLKRVGLRLDARLVLLTGGIDVEERTRAFVALLGGAFVRF